MPGRDCAQADNLDWIVRQEGPSGKLLVFAHRYHISSAPVTTSLSFGTAGNQVAGTYLRRRFGARLLTIGNLIGGGNIGCTSWNTKLPAATREAVDSVAGELGLPFFLLDLRKAPATVAGWLEREHRLAGLLDERFVPGRAFDVLFCVDTVTPACPG